MDTPRITGFHDILGTSIHEGDTLEITNKDVPAHTTLHEVRWKNEKFIVWSYGGQSELTDDLVQKLGLQVVKKEPMDNTTQQSTPWHFDVSEARSPESVILSCQRGSDRWQLVFQVLSMGMGDDWYIVGYNEVGTMHAVYAGPLPFEEAQFLMYARAQEAKNAARRFYSTVCEQTALAPSWAKTL